MQRNLADVFEVVVDTVPVREALVVCDRRLTYAELDERANRLAHHLAAAGIGPGDHVAAYLYNSSEFIDTMLAAVKHRPALINVNYRYGATELAYALSDPDAKAVVYDPPFATTLAGGEKDLSELGPRLEAGPAYEEALAGA